MANIVLPLASKAAEYLVAPVRLQCGYVIFPNSYVRQLKDEVEKLRNARDRVQHSVDAARNNIKRIEADVKSWMTKVETITNKAHDVLDHNGRAKKTCLNGWLPNPKGRYCLGKEASKTVKVIQELIKQGQFEKVDFENPPPALVGGASDVNSSASVGGDTITDSRASIFQDIMKALDDETLKVIGVYGPGGVGKTTLLKEVEKKLRAAGRPFRMIVKVEVSQIPDLDNIRDQIADALSLDLKDKQSPQGKRDALSERLKSDPNEKVLIILDNLWVKLDLEAVGIPWGDVSSKCKLLLTSRLKNVLEQEMGADPTFLLQGLKNDEAFGLFEKTVGDRLKGNEELKSIADQLVKKLAGLPLLIISVASTLKSSDESAWRNALIEIDDSNKEKKETIVRLSYDHLKSEDAKYLFLLCGLIGGTIQVELLFVLAMGLGLFAGFNKTIQTSRDRMNNMLNELRYACLLLDGGNDEDNVTIHDLYSEVVISAPFRGHNSLMMNSNCGSWPKEKLEKCWAICLTDVGKDGLAEIMTCQFRDLKILMLSQPQTWYWMFEDQHDERDCLGLLDFTHMQELRVLYLCSIHIITLPSSIEILGNLRSLYLDRCNVGDVAVLGKLKALQILSFTGSRISKLPKEIGELTNLRSLNLSNCRELRIIEFGVLKSLIKLEELHMKRSFDQWTGKDERPLKFRNAMLAEFKSLRKITSLEISIPNPTILLEDADLPFENLIRFWINIGDVDEDANLLENLIRYWSNIGDVVKSDIEGLRTMKLRLEGNDSILSEEWVQKNLDKTQYLHLDGLREFEKTPHELCIGGFPQLKHLIILNSPSIKYIASSSNDLRIDFVMLESLILDNLINLEKICHGLVAPKCFSTLKAVSVKKCDRLKNLWCLSEVQRTIQLKDIEVWDCDSMRAIILDDVREDKVAADDIVELLNVRCLDLQNLPNMMSFCGGAEITSEDALIKVNLPSLEKLKLDKVGSLTLGNCSKLLNVFSSTIIERLHNLKEVIIWNCDSLESLFDCGSLDANKERKIVLLPKLEVVEVNRARSLRCMVKSDSQMILGFPSLKAIRVENCSDLRYLFPNSLATMLEKLESIYISQCEQMKEVISKEKSGHSKAEVMSFASLHYLSISHCHNFEAFIRNPPSVKSLLGETTKLEDESPQPLFNEMVTFPNIQSLEVEGLQCKELWNDQIPDHSFSKLGSLKLKDCDNLQCIAPSYMWKRLHHSLHILEVISCRSIEIIYTGDGTDIECGELWKLVLHDLGNLRCIWQSDGLPNVPFPKLREVNVMRCSCLETLFPTFTVKFLGQIKELIVELCENMELIAGHEIGEEATRTRITFSELSALRLINLPKLKGILPERYSLKLPWSEDFPSLQARRIKNCRAVKNRGLGFSWSWHQIGKRTGLWG